MTSMIRYWRVIPKTDFSTLPDETLVSTQGCGYKGEGDNVPSHAIREGVIVTVAPHSIIFSISRIVIVISRCDNSARILVASKYF